jgi:hypothetical protein
MGRDKIKQKEKRGRGKSEKRQVMKKGYKQGSRDRKRNKLKGLGLYGRGMEKGEEIRLMG